MATLSATDLLRLLAEANARADAADARAGAADVRAEASTKETFFVAMRSISSSSSTDTTTKADVARRGAPEPDVGLDDDVFGSDFPDDDAAAAPDAWSEFCARHATAWRPPPTVAKLHENRHVHPTIGWALSAVTAGGGLRVWHDAAAPDDVALAHVRPDFTLTAARDAAPSLVGALLLVEVKRPAGISDAAYQACTYARRRVFKLCCEADARGEPLDGICVYGAATDGAHVVVVRVSSGAPPAGESFAYAQPCPVLQSAQLPFLGDWDFRSPPAFYGLAAAPAGFLALRRLCAAPRVLLGVSAEPLAELRVTLSIATGAEKTLVLGARLGCGGTSDVYECSGTSCVVKVARVATAGVAAEFYAEREALLAMATAAAASLVPTCVAFGSRVSDDARARAGDALGASLWPVLVLSPRGTPLAQWVTACVAEAASAGGASAAAARRLACADAVVLRVLDALDAAGRVGLVHCDVRPSKGVIAENDVAVLVDWGCARATGARLRKCGVVAFADARIFQLSAGVDAAPAVDALAALYTWFAVAFGQSCCAPWGEVGNDGELWATRARWIGEAAAERGPRAPAVARGIVDLGKLATGADAVAVARACVRAG